MAPKSRSTIKADSVIRYERQPSDPLTQWITEDDHQASDADLADSMEALLEGWTASTGSVKLDLYKGRVYGTFAVPAAGNIAVVATDALIGAKAIIIHQDSVPPTISIPAGASREDTDNLDAHYVPFQNNWIQLTCIQVSGTFAVRIELLRRKYYPFNGGVGSQVEGISGSGGIGTLLESDEYDEAKIVSLAKIQTVSANTTIAADAASAGKLYRCTNDSAAYLALPSLASGTSVPDGAIYHIHKVSGDATLTIRTNNTTDTFDSGLGGVSQTVQTAGSYKYIEILDIGDGYTFVADLTARIWRVLHRFSFKYGVIPLVLDGTRAVNFQDYLLARNANGELYAVTAVKPEELVTDYLVSPINEDATTSSQRIIRMPFPFRLTSVLVYCHTAPAGSTALMDVLKNGTSIFATRPSIDAGEKSSHTAAAAFSFTGAAAYVDFAAYDEVTFIMDQVGSSTAGRGYAIICYGTRIV